MARNRIESFFKITLIDKLSAPLKETSKRVGEASKITQRAGSGYARANENIARSMNKTKRSITSMKRELSDLERKRDIEVNVSNIQLANKRIKGLREEIARLQSETSDTQLHAGRSSNFFRFALRGALAIGAARGAVHFVNLAKNDETKRVAINTLLGDEKKGVALYKSLNEFANVTPFRNENVLGASRRLLAFGVQSKEIIKTLRVLGDLASGTQSNLEDMATVYGQIKTSGVAKLEDIYQLMHRGVPMYEALSKVMSTKGKEIPTGEIQALISKGKVSFEHVRLALQNTTAEGGKFYSMMIKQSETLNGKISTLRGILDQIMIKIGTELLPVVKSFLEMILHAVGQSRGIISMLTSLVKVLVAHKNALMILIPLWATYFAILIKNKVMALFFPQAFGRLNTKIARTGKLLVLATTGVRGFTLAVKALFASLSRTHLIIFFITAIISGLSLAWNWLTRVSKHTKNMQDAVAKATRESTQRLMDVKMAFDEVLNTTQNTEARRKMVEAFRKEHPAYLRGIDMEKASIQELKDAYTGLVGEMSKLAKISAYKGLIFKYEEAITENELKIEGGDTMEDVPWVWDTFSSAKVLREKSAKHWAKENEKKRRNIRSLEERLKKIEGEANKKLFDSSIKAQHQVLAPLSSAKDLGLTALSPGGEQAGDFTEGIPGGLSNEVHATVTGGKQPIHLSINIENALNISEFNSYSPDEDEEIQEKLVDTILRAINEGARRAQPLRSHHG